jgi:peptidoglycan L-alanyl-D-glutamate endopeptidase CwlK
MINSRNVNDLTGDMQHRCQKFIAMCKDAGIDVIVTSTYRDLESQNALYAQGRTTPGRIVTNAKAGYSAHNFRRAFDICIVVNGKAVWDDLDLYKQCGEIGEKCGLDWAGSWKSFKEYVHFQEKDLDMGALRKEYGVK